MTSRPGESPQLTLVQVRETISQEIGDLPWASEDGGDAFAYLATKAFCEIEKEEALEACVVGGPNDRGIDAIAEYAGGYCLVQAKYSAQEKPGNNVNLSVVNKLIAGYEWIRDGNPADAQEDGNAPLAQRASEFQERLGQQEDMPVKLVIIGLGSYPKSAKNRVEKFNEDTPANVSLEVFSGNEALELFRESWGALGGGPEEVELSIQGSGIEIGGQAGRKALVVTLCGRDLARLYKKYRARLFEQNVRQYQGRQNRVNKQMKATLEKSRGRSDFWYFNNGLTVVCKGFAFDSEQEILRIDGMQIVNGCQTTATIGESGLSEGELEKVLVGCRVIESQDAKFLLDIAEATNSQTPVKSRDLRSNDAIQKKLQELFEELSPSWFFVTKRGEWNAEVALEPALKTKFKQPNLKMPYGITARRIENELAAQARLAFMGRPNEARAKKANLFVPVEFEGFYEQVFGDANPENLLFPTLTALFCDARIQENKSLVKAVLEREKEEEKGKGPGTRTLHEEAAFRANEWMPYAQEFFVATIAKVLEQHYGEITKSKLKTLLNNPKREELFSELFEIARSMLSDLFLHQKAVAEGVGDTFVSQNFVKRGKSWEDSQEKLDSYLANHLKEFEGISFP